MSGERAYSKGRVCPCCIIPVVDHIGIPFHFPPEFFRFPCPLLLPHHVVPPQGGALSPQCIGVIQHYHMYAVLIAFVNSGWFMLLILFFFPGRFFSYDRLPYLFFANTLSHATLHTTHTLFCAAVYPFLFFHACVLCTLTFQATLCCMCALYTTCHADLHAVVYNMSYLHAAVHNMSALYTSSQYLPAAVYLYTSCHTYL